MNSARAGCEVAAALPVSQEELQGAGAPIAALHHPDRTIAVGEDTFPNSSPDTSWFALITSSRHEKVVARVLQNKGFETFLPLYTRRHARGRQFREFELPLFPGYLFCRSDLDTRMPILTTPGVIGIVSAGRVPLPVAEGEIADLKRAVQAGVSVTPHEFCQVGRYGRIQGGALDGVRGIVVSVKSPLRLILSVTMLQRSVQIEIDSDCVAVE